MTARPDAQSYEYQELLKKRTIHALYMKMKSWVQQDRRNIAIIPNDDILKKLSSYFIGRMRTGNLLFVGEGNLSFSLGVSKMPTVTPSRITATTYEEEQDITDYTKINANKLRMSGANVIHGVDAENLKKFFPYKTFDTIVFQFPNTGSRLPIEGRSANHVLVRNFLKSAEQCLRQNGTVLITAVDSPYYQGAFQFDEAALSAGFKKPVTYPFDPDKLPSYSHTNTNNEDSAIAEHDIFRTWVFTLQDRPSP